MSLHKIIQERLVLINLFKTTFQNEIEPSLETRFLRGPIQRKILKIHNLPLSGPNMRTINEAIEFSGYKKIFIQGLKYFKKIS